MPTEEAGGMRRLAGRWRVLSPLPIIERTVKLVYERRGVRRFVQHNRECLSDVDNQIPQRSEVRSPTFFPAKKKKSMGMLTWKFSLGYSR